MAVHLPSTPWLTSIGILSLDPTLGGPAVPAPLCQGLVYRNFYSFLFRSFFVLNAHKRGMIENSPELLHTEPFQKCHRVPVWFSHKSYLIMYITLVNLIVRENCFRAPFIDMVSLSSLFKNFAQNTGTMPVQVPVTLSVIPILIILRSWDIIKRRMIENAKFQLP